MIKRLLVISFGCLLVLTGCAKGTGHLQINKNGSMDLQFDVEVDPRAKLILDSTMEEKIKKQFTENGFTFENRTDGRTLEYHAEKHMSRFQTKEGDNQIINVKETNGFFYTKYEVDGQIDPRTYLQGLLSSIDSKNIPQNVLELFLAKLDFDFKITLPIHSIGENNADYIDGRTLGWDVPLTESTPIYFAFTVPNRKNISILIIGIIILFVIIFIWFRKRKNKK